jgi:antitoxin (DNA-binding transcriptional repressor) of toxin-antitoxin stability system
VSARTPTHIGVRYLRENFRSIAARLARGERFVILRHNQPIGALIPYSDLVRLLNRQRRSQSAHGSYTQRAEDR